MVLFTHNIKKIEGAAHKNGDVDGECKWDLRFRSHWALSDAKKWKLNIINGTIHTGLSEILSDSYACGKRQIFAKDFAKER